MRSVQEYTVGVQPVVALKLLPLPEQTALLDQDLEHANAAVNPSNAFFASMHRTTEAVGKRYIDTEWERETP